ncbi:MAG: HIT domain-containing protein [Acidimicrobiia bacterium]|nr:HIT domain-containing protein [Acidimicrobiia bacterium]
MRFVHNHAPPGYRCPFCRNVTTGESDLPPALGTSVQHAIRSAAIAMKAAYGCEGVSIRQHNEPAGEQDVWHYHVHVLPRWLGDELDRAEGAR